jgi:AraC-like DNA-binding protein
MTASQNNLANLGFQLAVPSRFLRPYVQSYWSFWRETPLSIYCEEYMHPRGGFGIVFNFGDPVYLDGRIINEPIFLDGANTQSRKMGFVGQIDLIGVRFQEGGAYPFLGVPLYELRNELALLDVLARWELLQFYERLAETAVLPARMQLLNQWLTGRLGLGKERSDLIPPSLALLRQQEGQLSIPELAQELAVSQRQLERLFRSQVGMAPKQYARLVRVETARLALKQLHVQTTTRLAVDLGFYDQAHFIREFRAVVGMTPFAYQKRKQTQFARR